MRFLSLLPVLFLLSCAQVSGPSEERLGVVQLDISGTDEAKAAFKKGLLLLHNFEYADAREQFQQARELDPSCSMAYWGEAMTWHHTLWSQQNTEEARVVLDALNQDPQGRVDAANTALEKDFLSAANILFGEGDKVNRDQMYSDFMAGMYQRYPENHEVAAFYALSLMGAVPMGRDDEKYGRGADIAQQILEANPKHPGALHYLIHAYDDPYHAHKALWAAGEYSVVAADASHALHMPSHIFIAMGMWDEVISTNEAAYRASVERMQRKGLENDARSYHSLLWLQYGYLQRGEQDQALALLKEMKHCTEELSSKVARSHLIAMKGAFLVETNQWEHELADLEVNLEGMHIRSVSRYLFIEGLKAWHLGDAAALEQAIAKLETSRSNASERLVASGVPMCSAASSYDNPPNQIDLDYTYIMELNLRAVAAWEAGDYKAARAYLDASTSLEEEAQYSYGPPEILKPSHELYGEFLLAIGEMAAAAEQFEIALKRNPGRALSLRGQERASTRSL
jgi:tetratricopeptide (TPR) repeat protein